MARRVTRKKKITKVVPVAHAYIHSSFNNTIVTFTDTDGKAICWSSAGAIGYKGSKKSTPFAAQLVAKTASEKATLFGVKTISIFVKGIGSGKDSALRQLQSSGFEVVQVKDITGRPHNGCRKPKKILNRLASR